MAYLTPPATQVSPLGALEPPLEPPTDESIRTYLMDLASQKEFASLRCTGHSDRIITLPGMQLHGAQVFVRNHLIRIPLTHVFFWTGREMIELISIAQEFTRRMPHHNIPHIFVLGFTQNIILTEMLRHPDFGFVSPDEAMELHHLCLQGPNLCIRLRVID